MRAPMSLPFFPDSPFILSRTGSGTLIPGTSLCRNSQLRSEANGITPM